MKWKVEHIAGKDEGGIGKANKNHEGQMCKTYYYNACLAIYDHILSSQIQVWCIYVLGTVKMCYL